MMMWVGLGMLCELKKLDGQSVSGWSDGWQVPFGQLAGSGSVLGEIAVMRVHFVCGPTAKRMS